MEELQLLIESVLGEVKSAMRSAFDEVGGTPVPDSSLDQAGLIDGHNIVLDYLEHNEAGLAFEHLLYMIVEPPLQISVDQFGRLSEAGELLGFGPDYLAGIETTSS